MYPGDEPESLIAARRKFAAFVDAQHELDYEGRITLALAKARRRPPNDSDTALEGCVARAMAEARPCGSSATRAVLVGVIRDTGLCLCHAPCGADCVECFACEGLVEVLSRVS